MAMPIFNPAGGASAVVDALKTSFAVIEFETNGTIINANSQFCRAVGYELSEIRGQHHRMFVASDYAASQEYREFWERLGRGQFNSGEYLRVGKGGEEIWLQASYTPVLNGRGRVVKVIKLALDITEAKRKSDNDFSVLKAIFRSQAVIEFDLEGTILNANENFLAVVGYSAQELIGRKHALLADPAYAASQDYRDFWDRLRRGEFMVDEFRRVGKGGREIWLQASYNPVFDADGKVIKIVKFAIDLSQRMANVAMVGEAISAMAGGDLEKRIDQRLMPSLDQLRIDFNAASQSLQEALHVVASSTSAIHTGAEEIAQASDDLSRRTEQQAASLEETAAALDEITATVRKTATGAKQASNVVSGAKQEAEHSGTVVSQAVQAMSQIEASSRQISQIIGVIDEIAFQTNLLALNAGVEAARAGDAGRGFAVVASEVRALAQRSAEAAKEIKGLISASTQHVGHGVDLVGQTGKALTSIAAKVADVDVLVSEIAASAQEQSSGLVQVNSAVNQMDQVVQQNAAMVEQSTAASHSLKSETQELARVVARFRVGRDQPAARPAPRTAEPSHRPAASPARAMIGKVAASFGVTKATGTDGWEEF
jgi:methyl-accepting chemotaxis protein